MTESKCSLTSCFTKTRRGAGGASSPAPYIDPSDYGFTKWADVVDSVLGHIMEEAHGLIKAGFRVRVNFIPAILIEGDPYDQVVRAFQPLPPVSGKS